LNSNSDGPESFGYLMIHKSQVRVLLPASVGIAQLAEQWNVRTRHHVRRPKFVGPRGPETVGYLC